MRFPDAIYIAVNTTPARMPTTTGVGGVSLDSAEAEELAGVATAETPNTGGDIPSTADTGWLYLGIASGGASEAGRWTSGQYQRMITVSC